MANFKLCHASSLDRVGPFRLNFNHWILCFELTIRYFAIGPMILSNLFIILTGILPLMVQIWIDHVKL